MATDYVESGHVEALKAAGAYGVLASGQVVQVVVGPEADTLASDIEDLLE